MFCCRGNTFWLHLWPLAWQRSREKERAKLNVWCLVSSRAQQPQEAEGRGGSEKPSWSLTLTRWSNELSWLPQYSGQGEASCFSSGIGYSREVASDRCQRTPLNGDNFQNSTETNSVFLDWTHLLEFCCCYCCGLIFFSKLDSLAVWLSLSREEQCCQLLPFASQMAIPSHFDVSWMKSKYLSRI